jgi:23S rRNA (uracil1939-C5)-methyltransferase
MEQKKHPGVPGTRTCPWLGRCGGCQSVNIPYADQLAAKQRMVQTLIGRFCPVEPIVGMEHPWHYRCKVQAAFGMDVRRRVISGVYQAGTHRIVPVEHCLIEDETASAILADIKKLLAEFRIMVFDERTMTGFLRHVLVRRGYATGQVMVVLVTAEPIFKLQKPFLAKLLALHPEITTVVLNRNDRFTPVVMGKQPGKVIYGPGWIEDRLCGMTFRISPKAFYQVNPAQTEKLYQTAVEFAGLTGKERVLDAYCGVGTIGLIASRFAGEVLGVELNADAVRDAAVNARRNDVKNCRFEQGDAGEWMTRLAESGEGADVVFLDPPRTGCSPEFLTALAQSKPRRVVYVSCDPETLARDLGWLTRNGFTAVRARPVDQFPHTRHVECVALLEWGKH